MTIFPTGGGRRRLNETPAINDPSPLSPSITDSGVHRMMLGTRITLHLHNGTEIEVSLTAIRDVSTWHDLVDRIVRGFPIEVMAARRRIFCGGVILWAEVSSDQIEDPTA